MTFKEVILLVHCCWLLWLKKQHHRRKTEHPCTKVAPHAQVYWTDTSYILETSKKNTVPVFTNSNQVSKSYILEHTHFIMYPLKSTHYHFTLWQFHIYMRSEICLYAIVHTQYHVHSHPLTRMMKLLMLKSVKYPGL